MRATSTTTPGPDSTAPSQDTATTCSLDRPPTTRGTPASESSPKRKDTRRSGLASALPRSAFAAVPPTASPAQPMARKSRALKMACDHRWNRPAPGPASGGAAASAESMTPTWLTVDQASSRLRSLWANASTAASSMVSDTAMPSTHRGVWLTDSSGKKPASTTVPAATIVAAWMSALAGVGPSMASASQSWKGIWADLPSTPMTTSVRNTARSVASGALQAVRASPTEVPVVVTLSMQAVGRAQVATTSCRFVVLAPAASPMMPSTNPMSATRVTRNALCAARRALCRRDQWPMRRYEHQPMTSQPTTVSTRSPETTTSSIAAVNSDTVAAKRGYRSSVSRYHVE